MTYELNVAHLYGDLMNTYGDVGNILALNYYAKQMDVKLNVEVVSLGQPFDANKYDMGFFGGGKILNKSLSRKISKPKKLH